MSNATYMHENTAPGPMRHPFKLYFYRLFSVPILLYLLPFVLLRVPGFEARGGSTFGPAIEYGFSSQHVDADVVIIGDSAAMIGLDPVEISRVTGAKTIILPNTASSLPVVGNLQLKRYLLNNRAPRLILFYLPPWNLNFEVQSKGEAIYEGEEALFAFGSLSEMGSFSRDHLLDSFFFPFRFYASDLAAVVTRYALHKPGLRQIRIAQGHFDPMAGHAAMPDGSCELPARLIRSNDMSTVQRLERRFTAARPWPWFTWRPFQDVRMPMS